MKLFTKWFILNSVVVTALVFAHFKGAIHQVISTDSSYLALIITILYFVMSAIIGYTCYLTDSAKAAVSSVDFIPNKLKLVKLISDHFTILGLLSTMIGFVIMLAKGPNLAEQIKSGFATALLPSIVGIIATMLANIQKYLLKNE